MTRPPNRLCWHDVVEDIEEIPITNKTHVKDTFFCKINVIRISPSNTSDEQRERLVDEVFEFQLKADLIGLLLETLRQTAARFPLCLSWRWSCFLLCVSHRKNWSDTATREMEDFLILFLLSVFNLSLLFNVYSFILCILILILYSLICFGIYFYVFCTYYWISFSHWQNNFHLEFWNIYSVWIRLKQIWN